MYGDKLIQCFTNHKRGRGMLTDNENRPLPQIYGTNKVLRVRIGTATLIQPSHNRCPILLTDEMVITLASSRNVSCDASFRIWRINAQYMYLLFLEPVLELEFWWTSCLTDHLVTAVASPGKFICFFDRRFPERCFNLHQWRRRGK